MSLVKILSNLSEDQKKILAADKQTAARFGEDVSRWPSFNILETLCESLAIPFVDVGVEMVDAEAFHEYQDKLSQWNCLPLYNSGLLMVMAVTEPWNEMYLRGLRKAIEKEIYLVGTTEESIDRAMALLSTEESGVLEAVKKEVKSKREFSSRPFERWPIEEDNYRSLVRCIIQKAYDMGVSDVILDPMDDRLSVRFRVHGHLEVMPPIEKKHMNALIMEFKLLSHVPTSDVSHFKSGRASIDLADDVKIDLRCEVQPTHYGEGVILRLLDPSFMDKFANSLPFTGEQRALADYCLNRTRGLILVTGPTGSGKTTTLYSCLTYIDYRTKNVRTLENPVEYAIDGIVQTQVGGGEDGTVTFLDGLRSHMRADPDVILLGEIRDESTAIAAMRAALTGHLVLSTLHTNDAIDSLNRLIDLGVSPYLIKSTLLLVVSQRLVPKLCPKCRQSIKTPSRVARHFSYYNEEPPEKIFVKGGCPECFHTGISGRIPIFEFFYPSVETRDIIRPGFKESDLRKSWRDNGGQNIVHGALNLVREGVIPYEELEVHETEYVSS